MRIFIFIRLIISTFLKLISKSISLYKKTFHFYQRTIEYNLKKNTRTNIKTHHGINQLI